MAPRRAARNGTAMSAPKVRNWAAPPAFWTHLPTPRPNTETRVIEPITATLTAAVYQGVAVSHEPAGPRR